jgi:uncharacterized protein (TIGR02996 family)
MPSPITPLLEQARGAIDRREPELALTSLLRAWSAVRAPELGELIERLSSELASARRPPSGATRAELEQRWRERAERADAVELGVLLPTLVDADSHQARKRLKLVARHAPDPRIASRLCAVVLDPPFTASSTAKFWQTLHELLCACPDPRVLARLEQAPSPDPQASSTLHRLDAWRRRSVVKLGEQLDALPISLTPGDLALVQAMASSFEQADAVEHDPGPELLAAILEAPGELDRRAVYADYLLSIGDPRGEFIALQLAELRGELDRAGKARVKTLLLEHGNGWLGPVARALVRDRTRFRAGFLAEARLKQNHRGLARLIGDPVWATVETLEFAPPTLVADPLLRSLRSLRWTTHQLLAAGELSVPSIEQLILEHSGWPRVTFEQLRVALEQPNLLPGLRSLTLEIIDIAQEQLAWLWAGPLGSRLRSLSLQLYVDVGLGLAGYLLSLRHARPDALAELTIEHPGLRARLLRIDGEWSRVELLAKPGAKLDLANELRLLEDLADLEIRS